MTFQESCWSWWWFWCSWLGLVSLMTLWMVCKCPEGVMFKIWLKSDEFEGIKNPVKDQWHFKNSCWSWWWFWHSWLGLVSLMTLWMVCKCPEGVMFKIWLKSDEFQGIKNPVKDRWHFKNSCWSWWWFWRSWLGLVSLMTLWIVSKCPEGALFKIWLNSVEFKGIKNTLKDGWHCWRFGGCWTFLTGAGVLDHDWDMSLKVIRVSVSIFVKFWCLEAEIWRVIAWFRVSPRRSAVGRLGSV